MDLRVQELSELIDEYEREVDSKDMELKRCKNNLKIFKKELLEHMEGKQKKLAGLEWKTILKHYYYYYFYQYLYE